MRLPALAALAVLASTALMAAPPAAGQDADDGCDQDSPCEISAFVTATGFVDARDVNATVGDWYVVATSNDLDERTHTVTLQRFGVTLTVAEMEEKRSPAFELKAEHLGEHLVRDSPTGATKVFRVLETDAVDHEAGLDASATSTRSRTPGVAVPLLAAAVVGLALLLRRRA